MKNSRLALVLKNFACLLFFVIVSALLAKVVSCQESTSEKQVEADSNGKIVLLEEYKSYMATPKNMFLYYCAPCHGENADGKGIYFTIDLKPKPTNLTDVEYMAKLTDDYLLNFITKGSAVMEKSDLCPPWGGTFDEERIKGIISFLRKQTIAKSAEKGKSDAEGAHVAVAASTAATGTQEIVKWGVLIALSLFFIVSARKEWMKLKIEKKTTKN